MKKYIAYFVIALLGGLVALGANSIMKKKTYTQVGVPNDSGIFHKANMPYTSTATPPDFTTAANSSVHTVVHIKVEMSRTNRRGGRNIFGFDDFFGDFFGQQQTPAMASGSGVIVSPDGYVVTNNHVVEDGDKIEVTLNDKRSFKGEVIGTDPQSDLAVIKLDAKELPYMNYGNSDALQLGEWVLAVGNPFNLTSTVTAGIVSAKARDINAIDAMSGNAKVASYIQTDAAVNRGNSGGPLVNTKGELIGINTLIASPNGTYSGYSFAIPANTVKKVVNDLIKYKQVQRAYMGIMMSELNSKLAEEKGIKELRGVYVAEVSDKSAAKNAGIKAGDVITHINNVAVNAPSELSEQISNYRPGDKITVTAARNGESKTYNLTLQNKDGNLSIVKKDDAGAIMPKLGASFQKADASLLKKLGIQNGVQVVNLTRGLMSEAGIQQGFVITEIDRVPVKSEEDIKLAIAGKKDGILVAGYYPNRVKAYYGVALN